MRDFLEFEKPLQELEERIEKLMKSGSDRKAVPRLIRILRGRLAKTERQLFGNLTPWQQTQIARHPQRPSILHYTHHMCEDFLELHGDRTFGDDKAIVGGFATFQNRSICVIGHVKGQNFKDRVKRNFGMPNPEGYRKALRLMQLAEKFKRPIVTFIDTPGAYPGVGAEERGQAGAIAKNLFMMSRLKVPIVAIIAGEGGKRRSIGIGGSRSDHDAGTFDLLGYFPGRVRGNSLGEFGQHASSSRGVEDDGHGTLQIRDCRRSHSRATRRSAS